MDGLISETDTPALLKVVILHNEVDQHASIADQDVIVQREAVQTALRELGCDVEILQCTLNLQLTANQLRRLQPDVVFNLVESLAGTDRLMSAVTLLLESMRIPFTGANSMSILQTSDKVAAKRLMSIAGLPTPRWCTAGTYCSDRAVANADTSHSRSSRHSVDANIEACGTLPLTNGLAIIKPVWEHASFGMDDHSVVDATNPSALQGLLKTRTASLGCLHFAEEFIDGREFNLSLLEHVDGHPIVLPPAEIDFSAYPTHKPRIVGHNAKWCEDSFEYQQTPRNFQFSQSDTELLLQLTKLATDCWHTFQLKGYARVDFRVDEKGRAYILEVNVNPCLSPDAGFSAALARAGYTLSAAVNQIVRCAIHSFSENVA